MVAALEIDHLYQEIQEHNNIDITHVFCSYTAKFGHPASNPFDLIHVDLYNGSLVNPLTIYQPERHAYKKRTAKHDRTPIHGSQRHLAVYWPE